MLILKEMVVKRGKLARQRAHQDLGRKKPFRFVLYKEGGEGEAGGAGKVDNFRK